MNHSKAFSLIELIVVITITSILVVGAIPILNAGMNHYFSARELTTISSKTDVAMSRMTRELLMATSFSTKSSDHIQFTTYNNDIIDFRRNSQNLERRQNGGTYRILTDEVETFSLQYFDAALASTSSLSTVRFVTLELVISNGTGNMDLVESVFPRNM